MDRADVGLGPNLVKNGNFRDGLEHWEGTHLELATVAGRRSLRGGPDWTTYASQPTGAVVTAGKTYRLKFSAMADPVVPNRFITIQLAATINGTDRYPGLFTIDYAHDTWTDFTGTLVPEASGTIEARIYLINQSPDVRVYITRIQIAEVLRPWRRLPRCLAWRARKLRRTAGEPTESER